MRILDRALHGLFPPLLALALIALAAPGRAEMVAGWDFSQYFGDGLLSIDGQTYTGVLSANYSNLDPTFNAGAESAAFGTMYIDGQFGSTAVPLGSGNEQFVPSAALFGGSLQSNLTAPVQQFGDNEFDSHTILVFEGQLFANFLSMIANSPMDVTFAATRGAAPPAGSHWILSLGARSFVETATVGVEFSPTGAGFASVRTLILNDVDSRYEVDLGPATSANAYVRLRFAPEGIAQPFIDNVAISVPEPGALGAGLAAAAALAACRRRRA